MPDREKVIRDLEELNETIRTANQFTFVSGSVCAVSRKRIENAIAMLKEQENLETRHKILVDSYDELLASLKDHEVVRCEDCRLRHEHKCEIWTDGVYNPDWFCADGQRRDEDG